MDDGSCQLYKQTTGLLQGPALRNRASFAFDGPLTTRASRERPECATRLLSIGGHFTTRIALFIVLSSTRRQITWVRKGSKHLSVLCRFRAAIICAGRDVTGGSRAQSHGSRHSVLTGDSCNGVVPISTRRRSQGHARAPLGYLKEIQHRLSLSPQSSLCFIPSLSPTDCNAAHFGHLGRLGLCRHSYHRHGFFDSDSRSHAECDRKDHDHRLALAGPVASRRDDGATDRERRRIPIPLVPPVPHAAHRRRQFFWLIPWRLFMPLPAAWTWLP
jgi:hypothetical protein